MDEIFRKALGLAIVVSIVVLPILGFLVHSVENNNTGFETKTFWDWMELLIIPVVLGGIAFFFQSTERDTERLIAANRMKLEREIATDRQQEAALQAYLDRMSELLLVRELRTSQNEEVRNVARIRTLTVLRGLDEARKAIVVLFLYESRLIVDELIVDLTGADLSGVKLSGVELSRVNLSKVNLSGAKLSSTKLNDANLNGANLHSAKLSGAIFARPT